MAYLINRNPAARIECLHILCKYILAKVGASKSFLLRDIKFSRDELNIHQYCTLLESTLGIKYCPYKQSPLDEAGCSLTNGVIVDTTKSKEVSNTVNALHALGFIERANRDCKLTEEGKKFASTKYDSKEMLIIIRNAVLNYGPIVGVLFQIKNLINNQNVFNSSSLLVGYPNTKEYVNYNNKQVLLSVGSKPDANTRTKSCLLAWLITAGIIYPYHLDMYEEHKLPQTLYRDYLNGLHRNNDKYVYVSMNTNMAPKIETINKPLDYNNLTKLTSALRENDSKNIREATLSYENRVKNRRFAIIFMLNEAYRTNNKLNIRDIVEVFNNHPDTFLVSHNDVEEVVVSELDIALTCGIPCEIIENTEATYLKPLNGINVKELSIGAPNELLTILKNNTIYG